MKLKLPRKDDATVDMAPMIDMVFLLLIFFMVASVVVTDKVKIDLPESQAAKVPEDIKGRLVLTVDANDQLYIGMTMITIEQLKEIITEELELDPNLRLMIRSDGSVQYQTNKKIMIACSEVGATDLIYATFED